MAKVKYGSNKLVVDLEKFEEDMQEWVKKGIAKTTLIIYNAAVALTPVDLGYLRESIDFKFTDGGYSSVVSVGAEYAVYVEFGTGVFATGPGGSRANRIPWSYEGDDGQWYTTYGQEAQPFWLPAVDKGEKFFRKYFG